MSRSVFSSISWSARRSRSSPASSRGPGWCGAEGGTGPRFAESARDWAIGGRLGYHRGHVVTLGIAPGSVETRGAASGGAAPDPGDRLVRRRFLLRHAGGLLSLGPRPAGARPPRAEGAASAVLPATCSCRQRAMDREGDPGPRCLQSRRSDGSARRRGRTAGGEPRRRCPGRGADGCPAQVRRRARATAGLKPFDSLHLR